jgi:hypothetical protein
MYFVNYGVKMKRKTKRLKAVAKRPRTGLQGAAHSWVGNERLVDTGTLRGSVLQRVAPAVRELVNVSRDDQLLEALSTNTAMDALIHLVTRDSAAAQVASKVHDPLREARARAAKKMADLLSAEGGPIGVEDVVNILRISRAAVDKRRKAGTLIGIDDGGRAVLYPGWQFTGTGLLPGLDDVLRAMTVSDPWMRLQFFMGHDADLDARPLDLLRAGKIREAIGAAGRFGRFGDDG